jgi:chemotaxis protein methyltransferase CheR
MMHFRSDSLGLAGSVTAIFRDLIHERLGLSYEPEAFDQVADRLAPLVVARGFGSFMDYYYLLKYENDAEEWLRVMDALSVRETYFWREIDQLRAMVHAVVPTLVAAAPHEPVRIWSVPCASGEEPLTIAMLLDEAGWFERVAIQIAASDASPAAIAKARAGRYSGRSFRNLSPELRERYFTQDGEAWVVAPRLHDRVRYDVVNLMDQEAVAAHARVPVIVCRNVFIYFSERTIRRAVEAFAQAMRRPAYLCLGTSESLLRLHTPFELREIDGAFMYVLPAEASRAGEATIGAEDVKRI